MNQLNDLSHDLREALRLNPLLEGLTRRTRPSTQAEWLARDRGKIRAHNLDSIASLEAMGRGEFAQPGDAPVTTELVQALAHYALLDAASCNRYEGPAAHAAARVGHVLRASVARRQLHGFQAIAQKCAAAQLPPKPRLLRHDRVLIGACILALLVAIAIATYGLPAGGAA